MLSSCSQSEMALLKTNNDYTPWKERNKRSIVTYVEIVAMATQSIAVVAT